MVGRTRTAPRAARSGARPNSPFGDRRKQEEQKRRRLQEKEDTAAPPPLKFRITAPKFQGIITP